MSGRTFSGGTSPRMSRDANCAAISLVSVRGRDSSTWPPFQAAARQEGGNGPEDLLLAPRREVRQATAYQGRAHRRIRHDLDRVAHRPRPPPRRQGTAELVAQPRTRTASVSGLAPAGPTAATSPDPTPTSRIQPAYSSPRGCPPSIFHWLVEWGLVASLPVSWLGLCRLGVTACRVSSRGGRAFPGARGFFLQDLGGQEAGAVCLRGR